MVFSIPLVSGGFFNQRERPATAPYGHAVSRLCCQTTTVATNHGGAFVLDFPDVEKRCLRVRRSGSGRRDEAVKPFAFA